MTTLVAGANKIQLVTDFAAGYPAWQPGSRISIAKSVDGNVATMLAGVPPSEASTPTLNCSQVVSFLWQDVQFCSAPNSGTGWGTEIYVSNSTAETSRHDYNAVESGKLGDTPPLDGASNSLAQSLTDPSGEKMVRIVKPCFYIGPGEQITPGFLALNMSEVFGGEFQMTYVWGLAGDNHIITLDLQITIPADAVIQSKTQLSVVPFYHYNPNFAVAGHVNKPFAAQEWVALADGATRAYVDGEISTTEVLMSKSADENFAMAAVYGAGALADAGSLGQGYKGLNGAGATPFKVGYGFCIKTYAGGIPAGVVTIPVAICFGTRADVISAVQTAYDNLAAASYPT